MIKLVVVDDQRTIKEFLKIHLDTVSDIRVVEFASNGQEAIEVVEKHQPDIVLMDIEMPIMNGIEATRIISERFLDASVILFTTRDNKQQLNAALQAGARGYILKTTSPQDLVEIIYLAAKGFYNIGPILGSWESKSTSTEMQAYRPELANVAKDSDMSQILCNLTDRLLELRQAVESQEDRIVNLPSRFVYGQKGLGHTAASKNLKKRRKNRLFFGGFIIGAFVVSAIVLIVMAVATFV